MAFFSLGGSAPMKAVLQKREGSLNIILKLWDTWLTICIPVEQVFLKELVNPVTAQPD